MAAKAASVKKGGYVKGRATPLYTPGQVRRTTGLKAAGPAFVKRR